MYQRNVVSFEHQSALMRASVEHVQSDGQHNLECGQTVRTLTDFLSRLLGLDINFYGIVKNNVHKLVETLL